MFGLVSIQTLQMLIGQLKSDMTKSFVYLSNSEYQLCNSHYRPQLTKYDPWLCLQWYLTWSEGIALTRACLTLTLVLHSGLAWTWYWDLNYMYGQGVRHHTTNCQWTAGERTDTQTDRTLFYLTNSRPHFIGGVVSLGVVWTDSVDSDGVFNW